MMTRFRYNLRDRRYGETFAHNQVIEAENKSDVRRALAAEWRRDVPRDARNCGFIPFRDVQIIWLEEIQ